MKKIYILICLFIFSIIRAIFNLHFEYITFTWLHYQINIEPSFFVFCILLIITTYSIIHKIYLTLASGILNGVNLWHKSSEKDIVKKLFLILYYTNINDYKNLEKVYTQIDKKHISLRIFPIHFINLIKYLGAKHLNYKSSIENLAYKLSQDKITKIFGIKALIEYYLAENNPLEAKKILDQELRLCTNFTWAKEYTIEINKRLGHFEEAASTFVSLIHSKIPHNIQSLEEVKHLLLNQSKFLLERQNIPAAKKAIKQILELDPLNAEAQILLIDIYISKGYKFWANHLIKKAWLSQPSKILLDKFTTNNYKYDGIKLLQKQEKLLKTNSSLNALMAFVKMFIEQNQFNKAKEYLDKISHKQKTPEFYRLLSEVELKTGGDPLMISHLLDKI